MDIKKIYNKYYAGSLFITINSSKEYKFEFSKDEHFGMISWLGVKDDRSTYESIDDYSYEYINFILNKGEWILLNRKFLILEKINEQ